MSMVAIAETGVAIFGLSLFSKGRSVINHFSHRGAVFGAAITVRRGGETLTVSIGG
jgi:hypothetical protein